MLVRYKISHPGRWLKLQIYNAKKHLNLRLLLCQRVKSSYFCWLDAFLTWIMMSKSVWNTQICSPMCRYVRLLPWYNCDRRRITIYYRPVSDTIAIAGQCYNCNRRTTFDRLSYTHLLFSDSQALVRQGHYFWWAIWKAITQLRGIQGKALVIPSQLGFLCGELQFQQ